MFIVTFLSQQLSSGCIICLPYIYLGQIYLLQRACVSLPCLKKLWISQKTQKVELNLHAKAVRLVTFPLGKLFNILVSEEVHGIKSVPEIQTSIEASPELTA